MSTTEDKKIVNVYLAAKEEWNERYGSFISQANFWKIIALISMLTAMIAVGGFIYSVSQNKFIPYIVQLDKLGAPISTHRATASAIKDPKIIKYALSEFVSNYRTIYNDKDVQVKMIKKAYNYVASNSPAYNMLSEHYVANPPFNRNERVQVKIISVLPLSEYTWQLDWEEKMFGKDGSIIETDYYKGVAKIVIVPPTKEEDILKNPIGLFITEFNFNRQIK